MVSMEIVNLTFIIMIIIHHKGYNLFNDLFFWIFNVEMHFINIHRKDKFKNYNN